MSLLSSRIHAYIRLTRLDRPIGTYLVLWPTLWALWMASNGRPDAQVLLVFVLGVVLMRSAGCAINDFADRKIDPHVERTRNRPLASGEIAAWEALAIFGVLSLVAFALVLTMNALTIWLSIPAVLLAASYPFMKRYTHLPQAYLGVAFGWAVPMAFAAETGSVPAAGWWLFAAVVLWALAYDTLYAITDRDDDLKIGVKSTAILFGRFDLLAITLFQLGMLVCLALAGSAFGRGSLYALGLGVAGLFILYQLWLARDRDPQQSFRAFLNNHYVGMVVFIGLLLDYLVVV